MIKGTLDGVLGNSFVEHKPGYGGPIHPWGYDHRQEDQAKRESGFYQARKTNPEVALMTPQEFEEWKKANGLPPTVRSTGALGGPVTPPETPWSMGGFKPIGTYDPNKPAKAEPIGTYDPNKPSFPVQLPYPARQTQIAQNVFSPILPWNWGKSQSVGEQVQQGTYEPDQPAVSTWDETLRNSSRRNRELQKVMDEAGW